MSDLQSPDFVLDSAVCYAALKIIIEGTLAKTRINKFCKSRDVFAVYRKLKFTYLSPGLTKRHVGQLEDKLCSLKYKG